MVMEYGGVRMVQLAQEFLEEFLDSYLWLILTISEFCAWSKCYVVVVVIVIIILMVGQVK